MKNHAKQYRDAYFSPSNRQPKYMRYNNHHICDFVSHFVSWKDMVIIMNSKGIVRAVDKMGRVVIPKEMRKQLKVENDVDSFEVFLENDAIILKKYRPTCVFCNSLKESVNFEGYNVCVDCIAHLQKRKEDSGLL